MSKSIDNLMAVAGTVTVIALSALFEGYKKESELQDVFHGGNTITFGDAQHTLVTPNDVLKGLEDAEESVSDMDDEDEDKQLFLRELGEVRSLLQSMVDRNVFFDLEN